MTYKFLDLDGLKHFLQQFVSKLKAVAFSGSYNDLSDKPTSLPANGGNADTVGGKSAATLQNYNNLSNKPSSLPANGGNSDTVDGKHATDLQNYNNLSNKPTIVNNGTTTAANTILDGRMGKTLADKDANLQSQITSLNSALTNVKVYSDLVGITFTPDGASQEYSWGTYFVPAGYCFLNAVITDNSQLQGKYVGIITQRYNKSNRMVSLFLNWRYSGTWEVLIALGKEKR